MLLKNYYNSKKFEKIKNDKKMIINYQSKKLY